MIRSNGYFTLFLETLSALACIPVVCVNKKTMQCKKCNNLFCSSLSFDRKKTFSDEKWEMIRHLLCWRYSNLDNNQPSASLSARSPLQFIKQRQIDLELGIIFREPICFSHSIFGDEYPIFLRRHQRNLNSEGYLNKIKDFFTFLGGGQAYL